MLTLPRAFTVAALLTVAVAPALADESYYMIVFASQHPDNQPKYSHTFAAFLQVTEGAGDKHMLETATISWLPATGNVEMVRLRPEPGKNFGLQETFDWAAKRQAPVSAFGPYRIKKELYESARRQVKKLASGAVLFKAAPLIRAEDAVSNCIRAVCDLDIVKEPLMTGTARGEEASSLIVRLFRPWIIRAEPIPTWAAERLGLTKHKIAFRTLD